MYIFLTASVLPLLCCWPTAQRLLKCQQSFLKLLCLMCDIGKMQIRRNALLDTRLQVRAGARNAAAGIMPPILLPPAAPSCPQRSAAVSGSGGVGSGSHASPTMHALTASAPSGSIPSHSAHAADASAVAAAVANMGMQLPAAQPTLPPVAASAFSRQPGTVALVSGQLPVLPPSQPTSWLLGCRSASDGLLQGSLAASMVPHARMLPPAERRRDAAEYQRRVRTRSEGSAAVPMDLDGSVPLEISGMAQSQP